MSGGSQGSNKQAGGPSPYVKLAVAAVFFLMLTGVSVWVVREFVIEPNKIVILLPQDVAQAAPAAVQPTARPRPTGPRVPVNNRPTFRGSVVDAISGDPIPTFRIRLGYTYNFNNGFGGNSPTQPQNYLPDNTQKQFQAGRYNLTSQYTLGTQAVWFVRVEAPGHLPQISPMQRGTATIDFKLQPAKDIDGLVLDATGAPVSGATVVYAIPGMSANLDPTQPGQASNANTTKTATDVSGHYTLTPQSGVIAIAAFNDSGFAEEDTTADAITPLRLAAWGKVDGKLIVAGQPAADRQIEIESTGRNNLNANILSYSSVQSGADGTFHFDKVAPGSLEISRMIRVPLRNNSYTLRPTQTKYVSVKAGETLNVQVGGVGRPVTGKLILPQGAGSIKDYYVNSNINGTTTPPLTDLPPAMPANIKNGTPAAQQIWLQFFRITPAGQQWTQAHPPQESFPVQYSIEMGTGNNFRIEDVVPGDYNMWINLNPLQNGRSYSAQQQIQFTMPPVPSGYSSDPLVLPDINLR